MKQKRQAGSTYLGTESAFLVSLIEHFSLPYIQSGGKKVDCVFFHCVRHGKYNKSTLNEEKCCQILNWIQNLLVSRARRGHSGLKPGTARLNKTKCLGSLEKQLTFWLVGEPQPD